LSVPALIISAALIFILPGSPARAAQVAGEAVAVKPKATLSNPEGMISLVVGTDVAMGDLIKTGSNGEVQLVFSDETRLVIGRKSSLIIEAYLLRSKNSANNFTVRALGGSFRMITGKSKKSAYKIKTPTATIGVRGTSFDFTVRRNGETGIVLFDGEARVCGDTGSCHTLNRSCSVAEVPRRRDVRVLKEIEDRNARIRRDFPYVASQRSLRRDFRVRTKGCGEIAAKIDQKEKTRAKITRRASVAKPEPAPECKPEYSRSKGRAGRNHGHHDRGSRSRGRGNSNSGRGRGRF
jgi:hypothetical protein